MTELEVILSFWVAVMSFATIFGIRAAYANGASDGCQFAMDPEHPGMQRAGRIARSRLETFYGKGNVPIIASQEPEEAMTPQHTQGNVSAERELLDRMQAFIARLVHQSAWSHSIGSELLTEYDILPASPRQGDEAVCATCGGAGQVCVGEYTTGSDPIGSHEMEFEPCEDCASPPFAQVREPTIGLVSEVLLAFLAKSYKDNGKSQEEDLFDCLVAAGFKVEGESQ